METDAGRGLERGGQLAIDVGQAAVVEEGSDPVHPRGVRVPDGGGGALLQNRGGPPVEIGPAVLQKFGIRRRKPAGGGCFSHGVAAEGGLPSQIAHLKHEIPHGRRRAEFLIQSKSLNEGGTADKKTLGNGLDGIIMRRFFRFCFRRIRHGKHDGGTGGRADGVQHRRVPAGSQWRVPVNESDERRRGIVHGKIQLLDKTLLRLAFQDLKVLDSAGGFACGGHCFQVVIFHKQKDRARRVAAANRLQPGQTFAQRGNVTLGRRHDHQFRLLAVIVSS